MSRLRVAAEWPAGSASSQKGDRTSPSGRKPWLGCPLLWGRVRRRPPNTTQTGPCAGDQTPI